MENKVTIKSPKQIEEFVARFLFAKNPGLDSVYTADMGEFFGTRTLYVSTGEVPPEQELALKNVASLRIGDESIDCGDCQAILVSHWELKESRWTKWER